jgi:hypothetical protein
MVNVLINYSVKILLIVPKPKILMMKKNIGNTDKLIRLLIALVIAVLYFMNLISGTLAIILGVVALAMVVTSLVNFCGLYAIFGWSTCKVKETGKP